MIDFNTIVTEVTTITNRPDLVKETQLAVKSATLQLHRSEFFYKDILEVAIQFNTLNYLQAIDYRSLFPRYRALKYLRKYDPTTNDANGKFFDIITPDEILDSYGCQRANIAYVAGSVIQIRSSDNIQYALIGLYQSPDVNPATYNSWIANEAMYAIVYKAASIMFGTVLGDIQRQNSNDKMAQLEMVEIINSNIVAKGF